MRCASPPDNVSAERESVRYSKPTSDKNLSRALISFKILFAISVFSLLKLKSSKNGISALTDISQTSAIFLPFILTESALSFSLLPLQVGQVISRTNLPISNLIKSLLLSARRLFKLLIIPSKDSAFLPLKCSKVLFLASFSYKSSLSPSLP